MSFSVIYQFPTDNVAPARATIGVDSGSEDADYPAACLTDGRLGRPAKLTGTSGSWVLAFAAPQRVDLVALGPHNLTAATLQGNATNAWTAPTFSHPLTIPVAAADGHSGNAWLDTTTLSGYTTSGFAFWRLLVTSASPCAVGELWLGSTKRLTPCAYLWDSTLEESQPTIQHQTEYMVPLFFGLNTRIRKLTIVFRAPDLGAVELLEWYRSTNGAAKCSLFVPNTTKNDAWWVRQAEDYTETAVATDVRDISMTLIEHATGVPL